MASLTVYPAVGRTVYAADLVTVITSVGAVIDPLPESDAGVPYVPEYYQRLLSKGLLLTYNPLGDSGGPPVTLPGGSSGGGSSAGVTHTIPGFTGGDVSGTAVQAADALIFSSLGANRTITGFDWSAAGASVKTVYNTDATYTLTVANNGTTAVKQVLTPTGSSVVIGPGKAGFVAYDTAAGKYRIPAVDAAQSSAQSAITTTALTTAFAATPSNYAVGTQITTSGRDSDGDNRAITVVVRSGTAPSNDVNVVASAGGKYLYRVGEPGYYISHTSLRANGVSDDTNALEYAVRHGKQLWLSSGDDVLITDTIRLSQAYTSKGFVLAGPRGPRDDSMPPFVRWGGGSSKFMFECATNFSSIRAVTLTVKSGNDLRGFINFGPVDGFQGSGLKLHDIVFSQGSGTYHYGVVCDYAQTGTSNFEDAEIIGCKFYEASEIGVWVRSGASQPFNWLVANCAFRNENGADPTGTGIQVDNYIASMQIRDIAWGRLACAVLADAQVRIHLTGDHDMEHVKRIYWQRNGVAGQLTIDGGRLQHSTRAYGHATTFPTIAASDARVILQETPGAGAVSVRNVNFAAGFLQADHRISVHPTTSLDIVGCTFPNVRPLSIAKITGGAKEGTVNFVGNTGFDGTSYYPLPNSVGGIETGYRDFTGTETAHAIQWLTPRAASPLLELREETVTGSPASSTASTLSGSLSRYGSIVQLSAAPGGSSGTNVKRVHYRASRNDVLSQTDPGVAIETITNNTTFRRTGTSPAIPTGTQWWVAAVIAWLEPYSGGDHDEQFVDFRSGGGNGWYMRQESGQISFSVSGTVYAMRTGHSDADDYRRFGTFLASYDAGTLKCYAAGVLANTYTGVTWTVPAAGTYLAVGYDPFGTATAGGLQANKRGVHGVCVGSGVPALADYQAWTRQVFESGALVAVPTVTNTHVLRMDGSTTIVNGGTAGAAGNITTTAGSGLVVQRERVTPSAKFFVSGYE